MKSTWVAIAAVGLLLSACAKPDINDGPTYLSSFPVQPESDGSYPTALAQGYLVIENGCIRLESTFGISYVVYWPNGYSYRDTSDSVEILDGDGAVATTVSYTPEAFVEMGGGELKRDVSEDFCGGISWLSSGVEVVDPPSSLSAFPTNPNDTSGGNAAYAEGQLVNEDGCLRIRSSDGTSTLIRWPYGYSYQDKSGNIVVFDADGKFKAALGDFIGLGGSETTATLPPRCDGPYWGAVSVTPIDSIDE